MPRTKKKKVVKKVLRSVKKSVKSSRTTTSRVKRLTAIHKKFDGWKWTESYNSFLLGIVVVVIAVLFVTSFIKQQNKIQDTSSIATAPTMTPTPTPGTTITEGGNTYYIVKADDSLWNIAVTVYNDGYKWTEIAKANNLANPETIFKGDKLLVPNAPQPSTLGQINQEQSSKQQSDAITANSYTVQKDDTLWVIAVRAYNDGYKWAEIAKANNLANPNLIHSGNILILPR